MATKSRRIEARVDPGDEEVIAAAAKISGLSVSSFVIRAARQEADRVTGRADTTLMSAELFESLISSLDTADELPTLAAEAAKERMYRRR